MRFTLVSLKGHDGQNVMSFFIWLMLMKGDKAVEVSEKLPDFGLLIVLNRAIYYCPL